MTCDCSPDDVPIADVWEYQRTSPWETCLWFRSVGDKALSVETDAAALLELGFCSRSQRKRVLFSSCTKILESWVQPPSQSLNPLPLSPQLLTGLCLTPPPGQQLLRRPHSVAMVAELQGVPPCVEFKSVITSTLWPCCIHESCFKWACIIKNDRNDQFISALRLLFKEKSCWCFSK